MELTDVYWNYKMSSWDRIRVLDIEASNMCNAACPMCARSFQGVDNPNLDLQNLKAVALEPLRPYLNNLKRLSFCGNYGDPILNKDLPDIIDFTREVNPHCSCIIHTNGGARTEAWWENLAKYPNLKVRFGIDGLEDTNHLYRRNVRWDLLQRNYRAFIKAGGHAEWKMIVFKHNEHEVELSRQRAVAEGFKDFMYVVTNRFTEGDKQTFYMHPDAKDQTVLEASTMEFDYEKGVASHSTRPIGVYSTKKALTTSGRAYSPDKIITQQAFSYKEATQEEQDNDISCYTQKEGIVYISANGDLYPCCHLGYPYAGQNIYDDLYWLDKSKINLYNNNANDIFKWFDEVERRWTQNDCLGTCTKVCGKKAKPNLFVKA